MKTRRGVSLVELLVVMSACSALLTISAVLLHRMMHSQTKTRAFFAVQRSGLRLAEQFRSDVHRAASATTDDLPDQVVLRLQLTASQQVEYRYAAGIVQRTLLEGDKTVGREEFVFPPSSEMTVSKQDSPSLIVLSVTSTPGDPGGPAQQSFATPVHLRVEARPSRDQQYAGVSPGQETPQ